MAIITITWNPALDEVLMVEAVQTLKATYNTVERHLFASGKGFNVARVLTELRVPVTAMGFVGNDTRSIYAAQLSSTYARLSLTSVVKPTRVNTTICDLNTRSVIHIRRGPTTIIRSDWQRLTLLARRKIHTGDIVVFGGTLPSGLHRGWARTFIEWCRNRGVVTVVDSSGADLDHLLYARPYLVKPNVEELSCLVGRRLRPSREADLLRAAVDILKRQVEVVVVSRGQYGALACTSKGAWSARLKLNFGPISATGNIGSGDALVAGIAYGISTGLPLKDSLSIGVACGAANMLNLGPGVLKKHDVERLHLHVVVKQVS